MEVIKWNNVRYVKRKKNFVVAKNAAMCGAAMLTVREEHIRLLAVTQTLAHPVSTSFRQKCNTPLDKPPIIW
jgi:hypothetical protein